MLQTKWENDTGCPTHLWPLRFYQYLGFLQYTQYCVYIVGVLKYNLFPSLNLINSSITTIRIFKFIVSLFQSDLIFFASIVRPFCWHLLNHICITPILWIVPVRYVTFANNYWHSLLKVGFWGLWLRFRGGKYNIGQMGYFRTPWLSPLIKM